ncbi:thioredoxin family protein [Oceanobacillus sp. 1P07AA]|uniref:thioredoxin family protein n=1 Tax=Oceanobacillus sp. 1P07AA TaxID=3132293 RepID=UPI0039A77934
MKEYTQLTSIEMVREFTRDNQLSFIYISRDNCSVCHAVWPKVQGLLGDYPQILVGKVDADKVKEIAGEYLVFTVPTMFLLLDQKELFRESRFIRIEQLKQNLERAILDI